MPRGSNPFSGTLKIVVLQDSGGLLPRCNRISMPGNGFSLTPQTLSSTGLGITEYRLYRTIVSSLGSYGAAGAAAPRPRPPRPASAWPPAAAGAGAGPPPPVSP